VSLNLEQFLLLVLLFFLLLVLSLQYKSTFLKLKKTWFFVGIASLLWIVAVLSFQDILRLMFPYLFPVLGIIAILILAIGGIKGAIQSRQRSKYQEPRPSFPSIEAKERKPPPNIEFSDEQKCPRCNVGTLRLVREVRPNLVTPADPATPFFRMDYYNVLVRRRICQSCGYEVTERELPGGRRFFRDSEGNVWVSLH